MPVDGSGMLSSSVLFSIGVLMFVIIKHDHGFRGLDEIGRPIERLVQISWMRYDVAHNGLMHHTAYLHTDTSKQAYTFRAYTYIEKNDNDAHDHLQETPNARYSSCLISIKLNGKFEEAHA